MNETSTSQITATPKLDRRAVAAWCLYDWANSAFTTLVVTFIYATYFTQSFAEDEIIGTALWSRAVAASAILIALLSPLLGAIADHSGNRRHFLVSMTVICATSSAALAFVPPGGGFSVLIALSLFVLANLSFEVGIVFYNSFLPNLVPRSMIGRVSGWGWSLGYAGGLACMVVALLGFVGLGDTAPWVSLSRAAGFHVRATNLLVAGWFLVFSLPMIFASRRLETSSSSAIRTTRRESVAAHVATALRDLIRTGHEIGRYREIVKFLVARLVYNDGLVTIFAFGGIYAAGTFGLTTEEVLVWGIVVNFAAGLGAWLFGHLDDHIGGKTTVLVSLIALTIATLAAVVVTTETSLWVLGALVGIFSGPAQSASRSLMGRLIPPGKESEFYGFYTLSGKCTSFLGPITFGLATQAFGTQRAGVATIIGFFVLGGALMLGLDEQKGIASAGQAD